MNYGTVVLKALFREIESKSITEAEKLYASDIHYTDVSSGVPYVCSIGTILVSAAKDMFPMYRLYQYHEGEKHYLIKLHFEDTVILSDIHESIFDTVQINFPEKKIELFKWKKYGR